ncbi:MAG: hypothetical protein PHR81_12475, partial [Bacteroidales bacterium]|nr:hypothetical protein [Bacteroidales bacterium]
MIPNKSFFRSGIVAIITLFLFLIPSVSMAADGSTDGISIGSIPLEFILFALILVGVAVFHKQTFWVAVIGLTVVFAYKLIFDPDFHVFEHFFGSNSFADQLFGKDASGEWMRQGEWGTLLNLLGLLLGFAVLAKVFEESGVPDIVPKYLPKGWMGPFILLVFVCFISSFLDNIAAALI